MARRNADQGSGGDRSRVRVFFAEAEGNNESLQDLMRALTGAMARAPLAPQPKLVQAGSSTVAADANTGSSTQTEETDSFDLGFEAPLEEPAASPARQKRGTGKPRERNAALTPVGSLDFIPKGKQSLKELATSKKLSTQVEQVLVSVYFLEHVLEAPNIGLNHIFTCFRHLGWRIPKDFGRTVRDAGGDKAWIDTRDMNDLKCTTIGTNHFEHDLPAAQPTCGDNSI